MLSSAARTQPTQSNAASRRGWSAARRAHHAAAIQRWKPWAKSTGPRTKAGKVKSAQNAWKHGGCAAPMRNVDAALARHARFLRTLNLLITARKHNPANELLARLQESLRREGETCLIMLCHMALQARAGSIMQKPCILGPPGAKS